jgi:nuclear transport factor 2 (NTF2) superfamily protein
MEEARPPLPPFTEAAARAKVKAAEDAWNTRDPARVAAAYTQDSVWRNRAEFIEGRGAIEAFLERKWARELDYRLRKSLWTFGDRRIAVRFQYEWHDGAGRWYRSYGNELWEFADNGLMRRREASINDVQIAASERRFAAATWQTDELPLR